MTITIDKLVHENIQIQYINQSKQQDEDDIMDQLIQLDDSTIPQIIEKFNSFDTNTEEQLFLLSQTINSFDKRSHLLRLLTVIEKHYFILDEKLQISEFYCDKVQEIIDKRKGKRPELLTLLVKLQQAVLEYLDEFRKLFEIAGPCFVKEKCGRFVQFLQNFHLLSEFNQTFLFKVLFQDQIAPTYLMNFSQVLFLCGLESTQQCRQFELLLLRLYQHIDLEDCKKVVGKTMQLKNQQTAEFLVNLNKNIQFVELLNYQLSNHNRRLSVFTRGEFHCYVIDRKYIQFRGARRASVPKVAQPDAFDMQFERSISSIQRDTVISKQLNRRTPIHLHHLKMSKHNNLANSQQIDEDAETIKMQIQQLKDETQQILNEQINLINTPVRQLSNDDYPGVKRQRGARSVGLQHAVQHYVETYNEQHPLYSSTSIQPQRTQSTGSNKRKYTLESNQQQLKFASAESQIIVVQQDEDVSIKNRGLNSEFEERIPRETDAQIVEDETNNVQQKDHSIIDDIKEDIIKDQLATQNDWKATNDENQQQIDYQQTIVAQTSRDQIFNVQPEQKSKSVHFKIQDIKVKSNKVSVASSDRKSEEGNVMDHVAEVNRKDWENSQDNTELSVPTLLRNPKYMSQDQIINPIKLEQDQ